MPQTWLAVSASRDETARLLADGPRRDFAELASAVDGAVLFRPEGSSRRGWRAKLFGAHVRQAWDLAGRTRRGDTLFADGEHNGLPLMVFLALRRRRPARVAMLGHLVTRRWKLLALRVISRLGVPATLVVHSTVQAAAARAAAGGRWRVALVPYQVDTAYWQRSLAAAPPDDDARPLVVAVGSEHRDYDTLVAAVDRLTVRVIIAAGSHWARETARARALPSNVTYLDAPLRFHELRDLYARAAMVVVPVHDVPNQSGITTLLEAMSMALPVVATASAGQRECITGPLVCDDGSFDGAATADRGPQAFGLPPDDASTGLYVPPGDAAALRAAIARLAGDPALRGSLGAAARAAAVRCFDVDRYVANLSAELGGAPAPLPVAAR